MHQFSSGRKIRDIYALRIDDGLLAILHFVQRGLSLSWCAVHIAEDDVHGSDLLV